MSESEALSLETKLTFWRTNMSKQKLTTDIMKQQGWINNPAFREDWREKFKQIEDQIGEVKSQLLKSIHPETAKLLQDMKGGTAFDEAVKKIKDQLETVKQQTFNYSEIEKILQNMKPKNFSAAQSYLLAKNFPSGYTPSLAPRPAPTQQFYLNGRPISKWELERTLNCKIDIK